MVRHRREKKRRDQLGEVPYESDAEESDYDHLTEMLDVDSELEVDVDSDDERRRR